VLVIYDEPIDKEINMTQHTINTLLHFPADFELPSGCDISIRVQNVTNRDAPKLHSQWGSNQLPSTLPIHFPVVIDSELNDIGSRFSIHVKISHDGIPVLLDLEQIFWWAGGDHNTDIHLSPVGYIAVEKSWMPRIGYPADSKLYVKLIEMTTEGQPELIISETVGLTAQMTPIYLKYDQSMIKPGQLYTLTGSFEGYGQHRMSLGLKPAKLILKPEIVQPPFFGG
jgi:uncharacterized lipoprotein YbaY